MFYGEPSVVAGVDEFCDDGLQGNDAGADGQGRTIAEGAAILEVDVAYALAGELCGVAKGDVLLARHLGHVVEEDGDAGLGACAAARFGCSNFTL